MPNNYADNEAPHAVEFEQEFYTPDHINKNCEIDYNEADDILDGAFYVNGERRNPWFHLRVNYATKIGETLRIVGNTEELGNWNAYKAPRMAWSEGNYWNLDVKLPAKFEYKYVVFDERAQQAVRWEEGPNRTMRAKVDPNEPLCSVFVEDVWGM